MSLIQTLIERRANTWEQAKALLDTVETAGDGFTAEQEEQWQKMNTELSDLDARIDELEDVEARNRKADEIREQYDNLPPASPERTKVEEDAEKLRKIARGESRAADFEWRDLTKGTATDGAELVPTGFLAQLNEHLIETAAIVGAGATVLRTASGEDLEIPKTTSYSAASIVAEGGTIGESDPQFGQVTLGSFKYGFITQASSELLQDSAIDLVSFLASQGGRALGEGFGGDVATGSGSGAPNGVVTAATVGHTQTTTGVAGVPQYDDLIDTIHSVISPYRRRSTAAFVMSDATLAAIRKLEDSQNRPLWVPSLTAGEPSTLLGYPVVVDHNIADAATSAKSLVFGDLSGYFARFSGSIRVERSDDFAFNTDLVSWRFLMRADGDLVDTNAVKTFEGAAT